MMPKNLQKASIKRKDPSRGITPDNNGPIMQQARGRKAGNTTSVMQTVEEDPTEPKGSTGLPPRTQMLPVNPNQNMQYFAPQPLSPYKNNQQKPAELPTKTMMLPPSQTPSFQPIQSNTPPRTQMLPVNPMVPMATSPRPPQRYPQNPYQQQNPLPPQIPQMPQTPRRNRSPLRNPVQPKTPPIQQQYPRAAPQFMNTSVGACMPFDQLPAIAAPSPYEPPPLAFQPSAEAYKKSAEKENGTVDGAEVSDKNKRKENINRWIREVLTNGIKGLREEYDKAPNGGSLESAKVFQNHPTHNRYVNIPCCDATRVKLVNDPHFYIHANVVSSAKNRRYICAQAPLQGTVEHFWKMVIVSGLEYIVMLCEFQEKGKQKSAVYYPVKVGSSINVGKLCKITKIASENLDKTLIVSTLRITKKDKHEVIVKHIHWHNWPDHGAPDNFLSPLTLLNHVKKCQKPIVVHCSAGVGRTGTLVLIFIILESLRLPEFSGVPRLLARLREERFKSIQTEIQYLYVHRCILEFLIHKDYQYSRPDYEKFVHEYTMIEKQSAEKDKKT